MRPKTITWTLYAIHELLSFRSHAYFLFIFDPNSTAVCWAKDWAQTPLHSLYDSTEVSLVGVNLNGLALPLRKTALKQGEGLSESRKQ